MCLTFPPNQREACDIPRASIKVGAENRLQLVGGSGASSGSITGTPLYPDGPNGTPITFNQNYTVPAGKTLYITNVQSNYFSNTLMIDGMRAVTMNSTVPMSFTAPGFANQTCASWWAVSSS